MFYGCCLEHTKGGSRGLKTRSSDWFQPLRRAQSGQQPPTDNLQGQGVSLKFDQSWVQVSRSETQPLAETTQDCDLLRLC